MVLPLFHMQLSALLQCSVLHINIHIFHGLLRNRSVFGWIVVRLQFFLLQRRAFVCIPNWSGGSTLHFAFLPSLDSIYCLVFTLGVKDRFACSPINCNISNNCNQIIKHGHVNDTIPIDFSEKKDQALQQIDSCCTTSGMSDLSTHSL